MPRRKVPRIPGLSAPPPEPHEEDESAALSDLSSLAARLGAAASASAEEQDAADAIFARLNRLTKEAQRRLFTRPEVRELFEVAAERDEPASADDPPGTIYYRMIAGAMTPWSKKPWTWHDLRPPWPTVTWIPERRMNLHFSGLNVSVFPRRSVTLPDVFYGLYQDSLRNQELAEQHASWLMKKSSHLDDPSIVTPDGASSRSVANHDGRLNLHVPGGGVPALAHVGDMDAEAS